MVMNGGRMRRERRERELQNMRGIGRKKASKQERDTREI
jgi:hypothetical protein